MLSGLDLGYAAALISALLGTKRRSCRGKEREMTDRTSQPKADTYGTDNARYNARYTIAFIHYARTRLMTKQEST